MGVEDLLKECIKQLVFERLKKLDVTKVIRALENAAGKINSRVAVTLDDSSKMFNIFVRLLNGDEEATEKVLIDAATVNGWVLLSKNDRRGIVWWFEPTAETKGPVPSNVLPDVLWHVTLEQYVEGVLSQGLVPRQRSFAGTSRRYTNRVYLATDEKGAKSTINREDNWVLLKIDRTQIPDIPFYVDQEFGFKKDGTPVAIYTSQAIPPQAISVDSKLFEALVALIAEAWYEEQYWDATAENLMLDEPGTIVEPEVRTAVFKYLKKMGLARGRDPRPKGPKRKTLKA